MAEVVRTAPAEFIEAGAKTYLDDLTKAIGTFKETDLSTIMGPQFVACLLYTSPSPRDAHESRMPSSA